MHYYEITSIKSLTSWLKSRVGESPRWYARIATGGRKCLWISSEPVIHFTWDNSTPDSLPLYPLTLPSPEDSREWWWRLWDGEMTVFRYHPRFEMACIAAAGTWASLSPWYVCRSKDEFAEMPEKQFRKLVGEPTFGDMLQEYNLLGISTRSLQLRTIAASTSAAGAASANSRRTNNRA